MMRSTPVSLVLLMLACDWMLACGGETRAPQASQPSQAAPQPAPTGAPQPAPPGPQHPTLDGFRGATGDLLRTRAGGFAHGTLVNVWASWCGSCKKELPMLAQVVEAYGEHGLGLLTVTADKPEALPKARELLETAKVTGEHYYLAGRVSTFKRALDPRWKGAVPATFLIDPAGQVRYFWNGPVMADEIREVVQRYLAGEPVDGMTDFTVSAQ